MTTEAAPDLIDEEWSWCAACQGLFSLTAIDNAWSCPAGGRHVRGPDSSVSTGGRFRLEGRRAGRVDAAVGVGDAVGASTLSDSAGQTAARWRFIEGFADVVGGQDAEPVGSTPPRLVGAESAVRFDGGALRVDAPSLDLQETLTAAWWMKADPEQPQSAVLLDHRVGIDSASPRERATAGFAVFINSGRLGVQLADGVTSQNYLGAGASVIGDPPRWRHVVITVGAELRIYLDGTLVFDVGAEELGSRSSVSRDAGTAGLFIGRHRHEDGPGFRGFLADLTIDRSVWSAETVAATYRASAAGRQPVVGVDGWLRCVACGALVVRSPGGRTPDGCAARGGGAHAVDESAAFTMPSAADSGASHRSTGWSSCSRCTAVFFEPFIAQSHCGAGGLHVAGGERLEVAVVQPPDFAHVETRREGARVLFVGANRSGHTVLELAREKRYLDEVTAQGDLLVRGLMNPTIDVLRQALLDDAPHIVQFSAHGAEDGGEAKLWLGEDEPVEAAALAELFAEAHAGPLAHHVELVVFNACRSIGLAEAVAPHATNVVAVAADIPDEAAVFFTPLLFSRLVAGHPIEEAVESARDALIADAHFGVHVVPRLLTPHDMKARP